MKRAIPVLMLFALAGCSKVKDEKTYDLAGGDVQILTATASTLTVNVSASSAPVKVYIVAGKDKAAAQDAILSSKEPTGALAKYTGTAGETISASPGSKGELVVMVYSDKKTNVTVKLSGS